MGLYDKFHALLLESLIHLSKQGAQLYLDDLPAAIYGGCNEYCSVADAERDLEEIGTWDCLRFVRDYETKVFGVVTTDISDPRAVANTIICILGEHLLAEVLDGTRFSQMPEGCLLTTQDYVDIYELAREWLDTNPRRVECLCGSCRAGGYGAGGPSPRGSHADGVKIILGRLFDLVI